MTNEANKRSRELRRREQHSQEGISPTSRNGSGGIPGIIATVYRGHTVSSQEKGTGRGVVFEATCWILKGTRGGPLIRVSLPSQLLAGNRLPTFPDITSRNPRAAPEGRDAISRKMAPRNSISLGRKGLPQP